MAQPGEGWTNNVVLTDGETVRVRPITPADAPALDAFHRRQSSESVYRRYFSPKPVLSEAELTRFTNVDFVDRVALVVDARGELIAWASYERWPGRDDADAAFMVDDEHHGRGIATILLEHLGAVARANGITRFTAEVLSDNRPMLAVFGRAGWPIERRFESGIVDLELALDDTAEYLDSVERREQRADSRAMARLLLPRSIAVVGASDRPHSVGAALWRNVSAAAVVPVFAVNPGRETVGGRRAWSSVRAIPADVSLAVIAVPAADLEAVVDDCIAARVRGAVVITGVDGSGIDVHALVDRARSHGLRIVGPGSMGIATPRRAVGLQACLVPVDITSGGIAISLQSGTLGASVLRMCQQLRIGISWFVSLGDKADVSGNDLLQFWEDDDETAVIAMYTESIGNSRKFARIARRVSRRRPIVAVRTGEAAESVSGAALYEQAGIVEVPSVATMLDAARVLATQPLMDGPRVAVLSNSRSPSTLARVALQSAGLVPVDGLEPLPWDSTSAGYESALRALLGDAGVDAVLVIHAPPLADDRPTPAAEIERAAASGTKPVLAVLLGHGDGPIRPGSPIPGFLLPEPAAAALGRLYRYSRWRSAEDHVDDDEVGDIDRVAATDVIASALARSVDSLDASAASTLLAAYGIAVPPVRVVGAEGAADAATAIGFPVAVKARRRHLGRSVFAGVALDLVDRADVENAVRTMHESLGADADLVVVQSMIPPGLDLRVRVVADALGPLIAVGLGGAGGDWLADEATRLAPLAWAAADALLAGSRAGAALASAGLDPAPVRDVLMRTAQLAADHPAVVRLELNPLIVSEASAFVTDVEVHVAPVRHVPGPLRRLE